MSPGDTKKPQHPSGHGIKKKDQPIDRTMSKGGMCVCVCMGGGVIVPGCIAAVVERKGQDLLLAAAEAITNSHRGQGALSRAVSPRVAAAGASTAVAVLPQLALRAEPGRREPG